jgi:hypothetical protein
MFLCIFVSGHYPLLFPDRGDIRAPWASFGHVPFPVVQGMDVHMQGDLENRGASWRTDNSDSSASPEKRLTGWSPGQHKPHLTRLM